MGALPGRKEAGVEYPWPEIVAELRRIEHESPGHWALMLEDVPTSLATAIRARRMLALRTEDGRVDVRVRNSRVVEAGKRRGDLWMRFIPDSEEAVEEGGEADVE